MANRPRDRAESAAAARWINPIVAGWITYYGRFYRSACIPSCTASIPT